MSQTWNTAYNATPVGSTTAAATIDTIIQEVKSELYKRLINLFNFADDPDGVGYAFDLVDDVVDSDHIADDAILSNHIGFDIDDVPDGTSYHRVPAVVFAARPSSAQSIPTATPTKILYATEEVDVGDDFADSKFTAPAAGTYFITASIAIESLANGYALIMTLYKNGEYAYRLGTMISSGSGWTQITGSRILQLAEGDYIELYVTNGDTVARNTYLPTVYAWFCGNMLWET